MWRLICGRPCSKATIRVLNKSWVIGYGGLLRGEHGGVRKADLPNEKGAYMLASRGGGQYMMPATSQGPHLTQETRV
jgi:hypothetical protein